MSPPSVLSDSDSTEMQRLEESESEPPRETSSFPSKDLPHDVVLKILTRLPVFRIVGYCNGLICGTVCYGRTIYLWNPSIGKCKTLTGTSLPVKAADTFKSALGFVYHSESDDYKIVRIVGWLKQNVIEAEEDNHNLLMELCIGQLGRMTNFGICHLMSILRNLEEIMLPPRNRLEGFLTEFKGLLALVVCGQDGDHGQCFMWVMREYGVVESWVKLIVPLELYRFFGCTNNGQLLIESYYDDGKLCLFDPETLLHSPERYLQDESGAFTTQESVQYKQWKIRDQALKTLLNATLSLSALSLVIRQSTARGVWEVLERRYTSLSRTHVLTLKGELDRIQKKNESMSAFLDRVKELRDKLSAVGVEVDDEELLHVVLKGLPSEYDAFCSAMRTRDRSISCEELHVLLTSEEESKKNSKNMSSDVPHMAMAANASVSSPTTNTPLPLFSPQWNRGRGADHRIIVGEDVVITAIHVEVFNSFIRICNRILKPFHRILQHHRIYVQRVKFRGKPGHVALDCFHRMNFAYQGRHPPAKLVAIASTNVSNAISAPTSNQSCWISDTGATDHFTPDITHIPDCHAYTGNDCVTVGNGQSLPITHTGNSQLRASSHLFHLRKVLHVPSMSSSLLSVYRFCKDNDASFHFDASKFHIKNLRSGKLLYSGLSERGLYPVRGVILPPSSSSSFAFSSTTSAQLWHTRLGHPQSRVFSHVLNKFLHVNSVSNKVPFCTHCVEGKHHQLPFTDSVSITTRPLELVHTDNGVAKRKHHHIVDMALTLISQSSFPLNLWPYAFSTIVFLINRLPSVSQQLTSPWECLFGSTPDYKSFHVFGCTCYPLLRSYSRHKLQPRSVPCVFLGYASNAKGFLCYDCSSHRFYVSRHIKFDETSFPYRNLPSQPSHSSSSSSVNSNTSSIWLSHLLFFHPCTVPSILGPPPSNSSVPLVSSSIVPSVSIDSYTHSSRSSIPDLPTAPISDTQPAPHNPEVPALVPAPLISSTNIHPMCTRAKSGITKRKPGFLATHTSIPGSLDYLNTEPPTYTIACKIPQWHEAMASEFAALQRQATWTLVPSSSSQHVIGCRWVFKLKRNTDGSVARFKARLVAKGNHQKAGLDFDETFSLVVKPATVRLVLFLAAQYRWSLHQLDVSNAFLHGSLKEHVFMRQPPGFVDPNHPSHVCLLQQKSIYDPSLFVYKNGSTVIYLLLYVDDIIITGSVPAAIQELIRGLAQVFELKDLGPLKYFLDLQVNYTTSGLLVHQTKYATDLLDKHNMSTCKPCSTPFVPPSTSVLTESSFLSDPFSYRSLIGTLQYLTFTRPDLSFAVNSLCQHMHQPTTSHLVAAKRVLRYIFGTISHGIFSAWSITVTAFTDSLGWQHMHQPLAFLFYWATIFSLGLLRNNQLSPDPG
uniref:Integrase catalytic domain-containing protein n=1 Tax=Fagus sylvatica TaxID=28930 RepID=A0A2N9FMK1_FAGSY